MLQNAPAHKVHFPAVCVLVLGAVYSRAMYGVQFMSGSGVAAMLGRLEAICVRPLRCTFGLPGTAHIHSMLAEADIPPMHSSVSSCCFPSLDALWRSRRRLHRANCWRPAW